MTNVEELKLPEDLKTLRAPNLPDICEKLNPALRGAGLRFGVYDSKSSSFYPCEAGSATHALLVIPADLRQKLEHVRCNRRSEIESLSQRSDYSFAEADGKHRFYAIIAYHNGEFQMGISDKNLADKLADSLLNRNR